MVYLVIEGLAGVEKLEEQVNRIQVKSENCNAIVKKLLRQSVGSGTVHLNQNKFVPNLFSESLLETAFIEVLKEFSNNSKELHGEVIYAEGEAEACISYLVSGETRISNVVILSNDTDFMIYCGCPGFVPLDTLDISSSKDGKTIWIRGWSYSQVSFCKFFGVPPICLPILSGLVGCDYRFPLQQERMLISARESIFRSSVSKRKKNRNRSLSNIIQVVVNFIASILRPKQNELKKNDEILEFVSTILSGHGSSQINRFRDLLSSFKHIAYLYGFDGYGGLNCKSLTFKNRKCGLLVCWADVERLKRDNIFICKPVLERISFSSSSPNHSLWNTKYLCDIRRRLFSLVTLQKGRTKNKEYIEYFAKCGGSIDMKHVRFENDLNVSMKDLSGVKLLSYILAFPDAACALEEEFLSIGKQSRLIFIIGLLVPSRFLRQLIVTSACFTEENWYEEGICNALIIDAQFLNSIAILQIVTYHVSMILMLTSDLFFFENSCKNNDISELTKILSIALQNSKKINTTSFLSDLPLGFLLEKWENVAPLKDEPK